MKTRDGMAPWSGLAGTACSSHPEQSNAKRESFQASNSLANGVSRDVACCAAWGAWRNLARCADNAWNPPQLACAWHFVRHDKVWLAGFQCIARDLPGLVCQYWGKDWSVHGSSQPRFYNTQLAKPRGHLRLTFFQRQVSSRKTCE